MLLWALLLRHHAWYDGYDGNDYVFHHALLRELLAEWESGSLGLDLWLPHGSMGTAVFRSYQNLGHLFLAAIAWLFEVEKLSRLIHFAVAIVLAAQGAIVYAAARRFGMRRAGSTAAALLCPLVASPRTTWGHQLESYLFLSDGLLTQAFAVPFLVMGLATGARLTGWARSSPLPKTRNGIELGIWLSLTFLTHHFFGFMGLGTIALWTLAGAFRKRRGASLIPLLAAAATFLGVSGYQLLSILQDAPLATRTIFYRPELYQGYGMAKLFQLVRQGTLLDAGRLPVLSILALVGLALALVPRRSDRVARAWIFPIALSVFFLCGRTTWGGVIDWIPFAAHVIAPRFVVLFQLSAVFLAACALERLWAKLWHAPLWPSWARAATFMAIAVSLSYLGYDRVRLIWANDEKMRTQAAESTKLDPGLVAHLAEVGRSGRLWAGVQVLRPPMLGKIPYFAVATQLGHEQISSPLHIMNYASDTRILYHPKRASLARVFNVAGVLLEAGEPAPDFFDKRYETKEVTLYRAPGRGPFDVIGIGSVSQVGMADHFRAVKAWTRSSGPERSEYASPVPEAVAARWPAAVPEVSPPGETARGEVVAWSRDRATHRATMVASGPGSYGTLRVSYHPRWRIRINGAPVFPRWVAPGFVAFPLQKGTNSVEIDFRPDPLRTRLFVLSVGIFLGWLLWKAFDIWFKAGSPARQPRSEALLPAISRLFGETH